MVATATRREHFNKYPDDGSDMSARCRVAGRVFDGETETVSVRILGGGELHAVGTGHRGYRVVVPTSGRVVASGLTRACAVRFAQAVGAMAVPGGGSRAPWWDEAAAEAILAGVFPAGTYHPASEG